MLDGLQQHLDPLGKGVADRHQPRVGVDHVVVDFGRTKWDLRPFDLPLLKASLGRWQDELATTGWNSLYWNNHDQPRIVSRWGDDSPEHRVRSAKLLGKEAPRLVGISEETTCYVSPAYFTEDDPFGDFIVHEVRESDEADRRKRSKPITENGKAKFLEGGI